MGFDVFTLTFRFIYLLLGYTIQVSIMRFIYPAILFFLISFFGYGQSFVIPDSLQHKTLSEIEGLFLKHYKDSLKLAVYSNTLLAKAKQENNLLELAKGYRYVSFNYKKDFLKRIAYLDSSITISKNLIDKNHLILSYLNRAGVQDEMGKFNQAFEDYLLALKQANKNENKKYYYMIKHNIGLLKEKIGELEESALMFKEVLDNGDDYTVNTSNYLSTLLALSIVYQKLKFTDSTRVYNIKGIKESIKNNSDTYYFFVLNEGINLFHTQQYKKSFDSITKGLLLIEKKYPLINKELIISGYLYTAKTSMKMKSSKYLESLLKIDQYYEDTGFTSLEMREGYELLINHYKEANDKNKQLYYINRLFRVDSVLDTNYKNLSKKIVHEYDTPKLLAEKQQLIDALSKKEKQTSTKFIFVLILAVVLIIVFAVTYRKNLRYKKRFTELMNTQAISASTYDGIINKKVADPETIGISEAIVTTILEGLTKFEANEGFLLASLTTATLAKQLHTNTKYLSKVINTYKQKSFSVYINELRVDYAIQKLKTDTKFRQYTIKAIAQESGFNTTEAFSKSFYKKTGIYPSYFIKQLEKESIV